MVQIWVFSVRLEIFKFGDILPKAPCEAEISYNILNSVFDTATDVIQMIVPKFASFRHFLTKIWVPQGGSIWAETGDFLGGEVFFIEKIVSWSFCELEQKWTYFYL